MNNFRRRTMRNLSEVAGENESNSILTGAMVSWIIALRALGVIGILLSLDVFITVVL